MNDIYGIPEAFHSNSKTLRRDVNFQCEFICSILQQFAFRISEVLRLNPDCIFDKRIVFVKISKSEHYAEINNSAFALQLLEFFEKMPSNAFSVNYNDVYRYIIKHKPECILHGKKKNRKITHAFRYIRAKEMKFIQDYEKKLQSSLHHKSIKSQNYYKILK